jgi:outer membrane protein
MFKMVKIAAAALVLATGFGAAAQAADIPSRVRTPVAAPIATFNPWMVRVRGVYVMPNDGSRVYAGGARVAGGKTDISNSIVPELDITYFFTPNFAAELILGTTPHTAKGAGTLAGLNKLGSVWLLPPTLTLQYHFTNFGAFKPYVGVGVNYTLFYGEKDNGLSRFRVSNTAGLALQVGFDYMFNQNWGINVDVKKLFLRPEAKGFLGAVPVKAKLDLDPWLIGVGVTYKF